MDFDDINPLPFDNFTLDLGLFNEVVDPDSLIDFNLDEDEVDFDELPPLPFDFVEDREVVDFERENRLRYADESPPDAENSLRGPFRDLESAQKYTGQFNGGFYYSYLYDGEDDLWYVEVGTSI